MPDWDDIEGEAKDAAGSLTGDDDGGEDEGTFDQAKDKAGDGFDKAKEEIDERI